MVEVKIEAIVVVWAILVLEVALVVEVTEFRVLEVIVLVMIFEPDVFVVTNVVAELTVLFSVVVVLSIETVKDKF